MTYAEWSKRRERYYHWLAMSFHGNAAPAGLRSIGWQDPSARHFARAIRISAARCFRNEHTAATAVGGAR